MNITDVKIRRLVPEGKMKAIVSLTFDDEFAIHNIKIIDGKDGLFIVMPNRKTADGVFKDVAHPLNSKMRSKIKNAVFAEYERILRAGGNEPAAESEAGFLTK